MLFILSLLIKVKGCNSLIISPYFFPQIKHPVDLFSWKQNNELLLNIENSWAAYPEDERSIVSSIFKFLKVILFFSHHVHW